MGKFNKATAAAVATAITSIAGAFIDASPEVLAAANTVIVTFLVWLIPNVET